LPTTPKVQNDQPATLEDFIIASANLIKPKAKFGYSPEAKDNVAKGWFSDGHFNYVVPELYFKRGGGNPNVFKTKLIEWIDANTSNQSPKPLVVAGLFTKRVQVPEDDEEEGWPDEEIVDQMQDVRDAVGAGEKKASGETHFAASALRLPDQAGPRPKDPPGPPPPGAKPPKKNLAQKLKEKHYKAKALVPKMRTAAGGPLGKPTVAFKLKAGGARDVEWAPAAANQKPHTWAVWVSTNNTWGDMQVFPRKVMKLEDIDPAVDKVRVMAIDRDGTQSLAGETP
jgi:hypothetical protein